MKYISTTIGTDSGEKGFLVKALMALLFFIPRANPDFEKLYNNVRLWWIEVDDKSGTPEREIGFDENNIPIVAAPFHDNYGLWTDSPVTFQDNNYDLIKSEDFEKVWNQFEINWNK